MPNYQCNVLEHIVLPSDLCNLGVGGMVEYAVKFVNMFGDLDIDHLV